MAEIPFNGQNVADVNRATIQNTAEAMSDELLAGLQATIVVKDIAEAVAIPSLADGAIVLIGNKHFKMVKGSTTPVHPKYILNVAGGRLERIFSPDETITCDSIADMLSLPESARVCKIIVKSFHEGLNLGGQARIRGVGKHMVDGFIADNVNYPTNWEDETQKEVWFTQGAEETEGWVIDLKDTVDIALFGAKPTDFTKNGEYPNGDGFTISNVDIYLENSFNNSKIINAVAKMCKINHAARSGFKTVLVDSNAYRYDEQLLFDSCNLNINGGFLDSNLPDNPNEWEGSIVYKGFRNKANFRIRRIEESDWVLDKSSGISLEGIFSKYYIDYIRGFCVSTYIGNGLFGWNKVFETETVSTQWSLVMHNNYDDLLARGIADPLANWLNSNVWYGGLSNITSSDRHYAEITDVNSGVSRGDIRINGKGNSLNHNTFINRWTEAHNENYVAFDLTDCGKIEFRDTRNEISGRSKLLKENNCRNIRFTGNYDKKPLKEQIERVIEPLANRSVNHPVITFDELSLEKHKIFGLENCKFQGKNRIYPMVWEDSITTVCTAWYKDSVEANIRLDKNLTIDSASANLSMGVQIKLNNSKMFEVDFEALEVDGHGCRFGFQLFDVNGVQIEGDLAVDSIQGSTSFLKTTSGDNHILVAYGGNDVFKGTVSFIVDDNVKYIKLNPFQLGSTVTYTKLDLYTDDKSSEIITYNTPEYPPTENVFSGMRHFNSELGKYVIYKEQNGDGTQHWVNLDGSEL